MLPVTPSTTRLPLNTPLPPNLFVKLPSAHREHSRIIFYFGIYKNSAVSVRHSAFNLVRVLVQVVYLAQADEGQVGVDVVEDAGLAGNHVSQPAGGDYTLANPPSSSLMRPTSPLDQLGVAQHQPGLKRQPWCSAQ